VSILKNEKPDIFKETYKFLEPMDYLTFNLTGKITATQKTMAPFMIVDNRNWECTEYSNALLNLADLEKDQFPDLLPNDGVVGPLDVSVAKELGLSPSTLVVSGISDSNASIIGSGAVNDFDAIIYIGTSLYMTCHIPFKKTDVIHMMTSLPCPFKSKYILFGEQGAGGKCVEFFLKNLVYFEDEFHTGPKPDDAYERFNTIASKAPIGSDGVIFLPWLNGSIVPDENPYARGGFFNLSLNTTRSHLTRSVMEGLAFNSRWTKGPAEKFIGRPIESFRFSGGGALSDVWAQIHADVLGVPINQVEDPVNATVRGIAMLALVSMGYLDIETLSKRVKIRQVFSPNHSHGKRYNHLYEQFCNIYKKNKKVFQALNAEIK
jgi:xylulokinase